MSGLLPDQRVVVDEKTGGHGTEFECAAAGNMIEQVAVEVDGAPERRLGAVAIVSRVYTAVLKDADVVYAPVGFDEVVVGEVRRLAACIDQRSA